MSKGTIWSCLFVVCSLLHEESNAICFIFVMYNCINASNLNPILSMWAKNLIMTLRLWKKVTSWSQICTAKLIIKQGHEDLCEQ